MKKLFALATLIALNSTLAHAGLYEDRVRAAAERQTQNSIRQMISRAEVVRVKDIGFIRAFGQAHSGYASQPVCEDSGFNYDRNSWRNTTKQSCANNYCVTVKTSGTTYEGHEDDDIYVSIAIRHMSITSCSVELRNGLACSISWNYDNNTFGGNCIDANGRTRKLSVPAKY